MNYWLHDFSGYASPGAVMSGAKSGYLVRSRTRSTVMGDSLTRVRGMRHSQPTVTWPKGKEERCGGDSQHTGRLPEDFQARGEAARYEGSLILDASILKLWHFSYILIIFPCFLWLFYLIIFLSLYLFSMPRHSHDSLLDDSCITMLSNQCLLSQYLMNNNSSPSN